MSIKRVFISIIAMLVLSGCSGDNCLDADDFGHINYVVSSRYKSSEFLGQVGTNQAASWHESGYRTNGKPLVIEVRPWSYETHKNNSSELSAWCPWYGTKDHFNELPPICERFRVCEFTDNEMCTNTVEAQINNSPCILTNGVGLYGLLARDENDPNISPTSKREPRGISFHLGEKPEISGGGFRDGALRGITSNGTFGDVGGVNFQYEPGSNYPEYSSADALKADYVNTKLYFKIVDRYYNDNGGQYRLAIKSGIHTTNADPITYVTNLVKDFLFGSTEDDGVIKRIYLQLVNNTGYQNSVSAILIIYVIYTSLAFLSGHIQLSNAEMVKRIVKIAIVSFLLTSEHSWNFFNDYLFVFFIDGMANILSIIEDAGASGPGSSGILALMIAPQTITKLLSLLFVDWLGWLYIILYVIALYFVLMVFFHAAVLYLTALMAIGVIIVMAPIFICFALFEVTSSLFENWLKQLTAYAIQPLILFTGLIFISMLIREEIYGALGFRVCKKGFPNMQTTVAQVSDKTKEEINFKNDNSIFYWWFPRPQKGEGFTRELQDIAIPVDHYFNLGGIEGSVIPALPDEYLIENGLSVSNTFCEAYQCNGPRYPDLPFLDPDKDQRRIQNFWQGNFVQLDGLLFLFAAIYLLHKFNSLAVSMAGFISGGMVRTNLAAAAGAASSNMWSQLNSKLKSGGSAVRGAVLRPAVKVARKAGGKVKQGVSYAANKTIGEQRIAKGAHRVRKSASYLNPKTNFERYKRASIGKNEHLSTKADPKIISEVQKRTGLKQKDIKKGSEDSYKKYLSDKLIDDVKPSIVGNERRKVADKAASALATRSSAEIKGEFSRIKFGTTLDKLSNDQLKEINDIVEDKEFKELFDNASNEKKFRSAYKEAKRDIDRPKKNYLRRVKEEYKKVKNSDSLLHNYSYKDERAKSKAKYKDKFAEYDKSYADKLKKAEKDRKKKK